ncbi:MAG: TonB-dependent receptor [Pseudomonadota bacterium]|nr:TonB-dependent receptor [Pseudomonadota bacterium]
MKLRLPSTGPTRAALRSFAISALFAATSASAQRVDENAVAQAQDAFGINVSGQNLGLYDPSNARGFSPSAAGNIRLDGLYFDQEGNFTSRLVGGYHILVGPAVLGHPFPAPSGIAEFQLRKPGDADVLSLSADIDSFSGYLFEADGQLHGVLPGLGLAGGVGLYHYDNWYGGTADTISSAVIAKWQPVAHLRITPFWSRIRNWRNEDTPTILFDGTDLPPAVDPRRFTGQHWATSNNTSLNYGAFADADLGPWQVRAGLFRSTSTNPISYAPLFLNTQPSGAADRVVLAERDQSAKATSGEIELSRTFSEGPRKHALHLAVWGRDQNRRYGASATATLTPGSIDRSDFTAPPTYVFGDQTHDQVRQLTYGIAYEGSWDRIGVVNLGLERSNYRKAVVTPTVALPVSRDQPWLFNASIAVRLTRAVTAYAGLSHGLEESDVAPNIAVNRDEAPPAIRTKQIDGGVKWSLTKHLTVVASLFQIEKPYYGLDSSRYFRNLGQIRHRGAELSLAGSPTPGLSVVAGALLLDAEVTGEQVAAGLVGRHPVGSSPGTYIASVDYRLPALKAISVDANVSHNARRVASVDDGVALPDRTLLDLGMRYRFPISGKPAVLRVQATNILNTFSWDVAGSSALQTHSPRQITARVTVDI